MPSASGNEFFERPIINSPYEYPDRHWELDAAGQPTQHTINKRRSVAFISPIPRPRKQKSRGQGSLVFDEGSGLSTEKQQYDPTPVINELRGIVDQWRNWPNVSDWQVTPETFKSRSSVLRMFTR
jgi:type III restriction enzyme